MAIITKNNEGIHSGASTHHHDHEIVPISLSIIKTTPKIGNIGSDTVIFLSDIFVLILL